jgi:RHS repeat-associated protein
MLYARGKPLGAVAPGVSEAGVSYTTRSYFGTDTFGSVKSATGDSGSPRALYEYDAFGVPIKGGFDGGVNAGYAGKPWDSVTGLYNYGYRDYEPSLGRFTTVDPIRDGFNWFAYTDNDPVNWVDLLGLKAVEEAEAINALGLAALTAMSPQMLSNWSVVAGIISSHWGNRDAPVQGVGTFHSGIDIAVVNGTAVFATGNGKVSQVAIHDHYGNVVVVTMDNGLITADMHLGSVTVQVGQTVTGGQQIGTSGTTGDWTTGGHDHFTVWDDASNVPNFGSGETMVPRDTIDPESVLPGMPSTISDKR